MSVDVVGLVLLLVPVTWCRSNVVICSVLMYACGSVICREVNNIIFCARSIEVWGVNESVLGLCMIARCCA